MVMETSTPTAPNWESPIYPIARGRAHNLLHIFPTQNVSSQLQGRAGMGIRGRRRADLVKVEVSRVVRYPVTWPRGGRGGGVNRTPWAARTELPTSYT